MKKFIVLIISLFLGMFLSNITTSTNTIKKNDITVLATCTGNNVVLATNVLDTNYSFINSGTNLHYYLNSIADICSNNHSTNLNSSNLLTPIFGISKVYTSIVTTYESVSNPDKAKTLGLLGIRNRLHFNLYLYHSVNKLGRT
jgi:hypothetical protein